MSIEPKQVFVLNDYTLIKPCYITNQAILWKEYSSFLSFFIYRNDITIRKSKQILKDVIYRRIFNKNSNEYIQKQIIKHFLLKKIFSWVFTDNKWSIHTEGILRNDYIVCRRSMFVDFMSCPYPRKYMYNWVINHLAM